MQPQKIHYRKASKTLELTFQNTLYSLSAEFLRVHSPSAEVRGHGGKGEVLQIEKKNVAITGIEASGNYAVKISYDDGHDSGLYSWDYLWELCQHQEEYWQKYIEKLEAAGQKRESSVFFKSV
jgi:DUF971 family protein